MSEGRLVVCATPIGNLGDVSERLIGALREADVIYAEDTRRTAKLLSHFGITTRLKSLLGAPLEARRRELLSDLGRGMNVALVSDAGMPTVSDPGSELIGAAHAGGVVVTVVPGPSAATAAVALSGFDADRFVFEGFLPKKGKERSLRIAQIAGEDRTVVVFASPHRVADDLADLLDQCGGERRVAVMRELTKVHEEVWIGTIGAAVDRWGEARGEFTLVIEGVGPAEPDEEAALSLARQLVTAGASYSQAARTAAQRTGVPRRTVYEALLEDQEIS